MAVALVHFVDATTIHWQRGASVPERAAQFVVAFAIPIASAVIYPYLKCGWRVALAVVFAFAAVSTGVVIHIIGPVKNGHIGGGDYTGIAWLGAGVVLLTMAVPVLFASLPGWRWRIVGLPLSAVVVMYALFPGLIAVYITHAPRYQITSIELGRPYEDVEFETRDGLTIRASYVPSQNGAAVILLHGSGGARIRPVDHAQMLLDHGYGVLLVDARGHGESDGQTNALGWGAWPDVEAASRYLAERPDVHDGRIGMVGISMGAEIGLDAASHIDTLRVLVSDGAGVRSFNELRSLPFSWQHALEYPTQAVANGFVAVFSGTWLPPAIEDRVGLIDTPTLLISSKVREERDINRIWYGKMNSTAELWEISDAGHVAGLRTHPEEYESRVVGFLDDHLLR
jgi:pimeloyl-ACP methyl ester carboxylesterase